MMELFFHPFWMTVDMNPFLCFHLLAPALKSTSYFVFLMVDTHSNQRVMQELRCFMQAPRPRSHNHTLLVIQPFAVENPWESHISEDEIDKVMIDRALPQKKKQKNGDFPWFSIAIVWLDSHIRRWGRRYGWYSHRDDAGETTGGKPWIWVGEKWEPVGTTDDLVILRLFFVLTCINHPFFWGVPNFEP